MKSLHVAALTACALAIAWGAAAASARDAGPASARERVARLWQPKTTACQALSTAEWARSYLPPPVSAGFSQGGEPIYCFWQGGDDANATIDLYYYPAPAAAAANFASQGGCTPHEQRPKVAGGKATYCFSAGVSHLAELQGHMWVFFTAKNRKLAEAAQLQALLALARTAFARLGH